MGHVSPVHPASFCSPFPFLVLLPMCCQEQVNCKIFLLKILLTDDPFFFLMHLGNHTFAAVRGTESYSRLQSLGVVLEEMNSLIAYPYIDVEGRRRLHILLGGDYKVCLRLALILLSRRSLYVLFLSLVPPVSHGNE